MTTASAADSPTEPVDSKKKQHDFDPDLYRMTIGEHLEELRSRLMYGLIGFSVALVFCLVFAKSHVVPAFCRPLVNALVAEDINPQLIVDELGEGFMVYITISLISAAAISSPWFLYQLWQFVAAGLYPNERKYVTRYLPVSIVLLISGMLFVYFLVLPWTIEFFLEFNGGFELPHVAPVAAVVDPAPAAAAATPPPAGGLQVAEIPQFRGDPPKVSEGHIWIDSDEGKLKLFFGGKVRVIGINSPNLIAQEYKLAHYIDLVVAMLLTFGLSFQLPLVVLALERIGIVEVAALRAGRRYVYFAMVVIAAIITPGDVVTATVALIVPLIGLYELGIWLARFGRKPDASAVA
jgi:sec-independent protein translocase protein TatC